MKTSTKVLLYWVIFWISIIAIYNITLQTVLFLDVVSKDDAAEYSIILTSFILFLSLLIIFLQWIKKMKMKIKNFKRVSNNAPNKIGVYIASMDGKVVYVGRAIEERYDQSTSGLRKRLKEHYRGSSSGNSLLFMHRDKIHIETRVVSSVEKAKKLEAKLIRKYNTVKNDGWNKRYED